MAQLSWDFNYFYCFPATADIVIDVDELDNILPSWSSSTLTSMTMIFSTNPRPMIEVMWHSEWQRSWHYDDRGLPGSGRKKYLASNESSWWQTPKWRRFRVNNLFPNAILLTKVKTHIKLHDIFWYEACVTPLYLT